MSEKEKQSGVILPFKKPKWAKTGKKVGEYNKDILKILLEAKEDDTDESGLEIGPKIKNNQEIPRKIIKFSSILSGKMPEEIEMIYFELVSRKDYKKIFELATFMIAMESRKDFGKILVQIWPNWTKKDMTLNFNKTQLIWLDRWRDAIDKLKRS